MTDSPVTLVPPPRGVSEIRRLVGQRHRPQGSAAPAIPSPRVPVEGSLALDLWAAQESGEVSDTPAFEIPDVEPWARRFSQAVVEAVGGVRPVTQLVRWTSRRVYVDLERRVRVVAEARGAGRAASLVRPRVHSVRVCYPAAGVAEIAVHVRHGNRSRALAARLEFLRGNWCCTALEVG